MVTFYHRDILFGYRVILVTLKEGKFSETLCIFQQKYKHTWRYGLLVVKVYFISQDISVIQ